MPVTIVDDITVMRPRIGYFNMFDAGTVTASSEDTANNGQKENVRDHLPYVRWKSTAGGTQWIQAVDSTVLVTYGAIYGHNLGTVGATVQFQYSDNAGSTWSNLGSSVSPSSDDECIYQIWNGVNAGYVRAYITGASGAVQIGVLHMGWDMVCERGLAPGQGTPFMQRSNEITRNETHGGQQLPRIIVRKGYDFSIALKGLTNTWYRNNWLPFEDHAEQWGFFYKPLPVTAPTEVLWCELDKKLPRATYSSVQHVSLSVKCVGRYKS